MKLDKKATFKIGFAFMAICCFWELYDYIIPLVMTRTYGFNASQRGAVMGIDNLLAIFLLPFFGALSDKSNNRRGRRTPYIFIGGLLSIVFLLILTFIEAGAFNNLTKLGLREADIIVGKYMGQENIDKMVSIAKGVDQAQLSNPLKTALANLLSSNYIYSDFILFKNSNNDTLYEIYKIFNLAQDKMTMTITKQAPGNISAFLIVLLFLLLAMASFRSAAVALMPDATSKPLRSTANAIINFTGGIGGFLAIVTYTLFTKDLYKGFTLAFLIVALIMTLIFVMYMILVNETKLVNQRYIQEELHDYKDIPIGETSEQRKHNKIGLLLILFTIFFWFIGFNATKSHFSVYATKSLGFTGRSVGIITLANGLGGAIALIPVSLITKKIGRKKTVLLGLFITSIALLLCIFVKPSNKWLLAVFFLIAGFGSIIINVNTLPMALDLSDTSNVGKYTGYYYAASMSAQAITPYLAGLVMDKTQDKFLFIYSSVALLISLIIIMLLKPGSGELSSKKQ